MSAGNGKKSPGADPKRRAATKTPVAIKPKGGSWAGGATGVATADTGSPKRPPPASSAPSGGKSPGNDSTPEPAVLEPPPSVPPAAKPPAAPIAWYLFMGCIFLMLGGAIGGYYFLWQRQGNLGARWAAPMESLAQRVAVLEKRPAGMGDRLEALEAEMAEARLTASPENLLWALAEIESLMVLAMHRLDLQADVAGALAALQAADARLEGLTDVGLLPVREQLRADVDILRAVNAPDLRGISDQLINLYRSIRHLPERKSPGEAPSEAIPPAQEHTQWWQRLGHWITSRVSVRRATDATGPRYTGLTQEQAAGLARLEIENARLSLQARDEQSFRVTLRVISDLLMTHYDTEQTSVQNTLAMIEELKGVQLEPELPDLSSSIEALRAYFHARFPRGS